MFVGMISDRSADAQADLDFRRHPHLHSDGVVDTDLRRSLPRGPMKIVATLLGCCLAILSVPWAAQYSEALEEISPAIQATGWAFYGLVDARVARDLGAADDLSSRRNTAGRRGSNSRSRDSCSTASRCSSPPTTPRSRLAHDAETGNAKPPATACATGASCACGGRTASG